MDLAVKDLVQIFQVSEKTVYHWIKDDGLPFHRVQEQYRFNRTALMEWAQQKRIAVPPEIWKEEPDTRTNPSLIDAITEGGVHYRVPGKTKKEALASIARLVKLPPSFSAQELTELLLAREALSSTGIGQGVAVPHVRDPIIVPLTRPSVSVCFLEKPIDFAAVDGKPVHTFFLLLSTTIREHLGLLSKIAYILHDPILLEILANRGSQESLLQKIRMIEDELDKTKKNK